MGYHPEVILSGRRINDGMGAYVASQLIKQMIKRRLQVEGARVLVMGLTFKENCPDLRNTRVVDILQELKDYNVEVDVYDPRVDAAEAEAEYGLQLISEPECDTYDAIILAVAHQEFRDLGSAAVRRWGKTSHVLYDLKYAFPKQEVDIRL